MFMTPTTTPSARTERSGANRRSRSSYQRRRQRSNDATASTASYTSTTSSQHHEAEFGPFRPRQLLGGMSANSARLHR
jgi:hypothetical protein